MNSTNKKRRIGLAVLFFLILISIPLYFIFFQKTNPRFTKIALKTNGKTYMYCFGLNKEKNTKMSINWHYNQKELEYIPKKNCENRSFWTSTSVTPGETSFYKRKLLVVSIQDLASFYNCSISYNKKDDVLFISK